MSKIICDVCGTTYPDTAAQCPICGCARPEEPQTIETDTASDRQNGTYTYVKGGRFSKSNVRKRNHMVKAAPVYNDEPDDDEDSLPQDSNRGLTIAIIVLLLAIIAVAAYIYIRFFMPAQPDSGGPDTTTTSQTQTTPADAQTTPAPSEQETTPAPTDPPETTPAEIPCSSISLSSSSLTLSELGATAQLTATANPEGCTDPISFVSSDPNVVSVDASGLVTAVAEGSATVSVNCGDLTAQCTVSVVLPTQAKVYKFNLPDGKEGYIEVGQKFALRLRDEDRNPADVTDWKSSNEGIVSIARSGDITGVSAGRCKITCTYEGVTYECTIEVGNP